jgi:hypothetical protein
MRASLFALICLSMACCNCGCITHSARVVNPPDQAQSGVVVGTYHDRLPADLEFHNQLPQNVLITAWNRDEHSGVISRYDGYCRTPLPWWQRFPADIVADLTPIDFTISATQTIAVREVTGTDKSWIDQARRDGYVHEVKP